MSHEPGHFVQTEKQRQAAFSAAGLSETSTVAAGFGVQSPDPLSSANLVPTPTINFQAPEVPTVGGDVDIPETTTPPETDKVPGTPFGDQLTDLVSSLTSGPSSELGGEIAGFRTEQKKESGLSGFLKTEEDLFRRAQSLQIKSQDLGLRVGEEAQRIQQESFGRGRTKAGTAPLTAAAQRRVNLQRAEVRGDLLETIATLNAIQGRITTARSQIEDAVEAKFGVRIAEREAKINNLDILIKSGVLDKEEEKRAAAQLAIQEAAQEKDEEAKQTKLDISEAVFDEDVLAILSELPGGSQVIQEALAAGSVEEANQILFEAGAFVAGAAKLSTQVVEIGGRKVLIDTQTGNTIRDLGPAKATGPGSITSGISPVTGKAFTQSQSNAGTFAQRMTIADTRLDEGKLFKDIALFGLQFLKGDERRQFEQASLNFITAQLRKESGAAISDSEFETAGRVYIPQFGDSDEQLEIKAIARTVAIQGMINESVGAFEQLQESLDSTTSAPQTGTTSSGIKYTIE